MGVNTGGMSQVTIEQLEADNLRLQAVVERLNDEIDQAKTEAETMVASEVIAGNIVKENWARGEVTMAVKIKAIFVEYAQKATKGGE